MEKPCLHCKNIFRGRKESKYCGRKCANKGRTVSDDTRKKFSEHHSKRKRKPFSKETKIKMSLAKTGEKTFSGFKTTEQHRSRNSKEYIEWRTKVFIRDSFTCQICRQVGGGLEGHHIKSFAEYKKLRYLLYNGITLCVGCHKIVDFHRR